MKTDQFYVVYKTTPDSEKADIFNGEPASLQSLYNQFQGGLKPEMIHGIFTEKSEAEKEAGVMYKRAVGMKKEGGLFLSSARERFKHFIRALEELSTRYGVAVQSTGGVMILDKKQKIQYSRDHTSGDIQVYF